MKNLAENFTSSLSASQRNALRVLLHSRKHKRNLAAALGFPVPKLVEPEPDWEAEFVLVEVSVNK